jgi:hypothetical protein
MRITAKDLTIIRELHRTGYSNANLLSLALGVPPTKYRWSYLDHRLSRLAREDYLYRKPYQPGGAFGAGGMQYAYSIGLKALDFLDLEPEEKARIASRVRNSRDMGLNRLEHDLLTTKLRAHLLELQRRNTLTLGDWFPGTEAELIGLWRNKGYEIEPDACAVVSIAGETFRFAIETDMVTKSVRTLEPKLLRYESLFEKNPKGYRFRIQDSVYRSNLLSVIHLIRDCHSGNPTLRTQRMETVKDTLERMPELKHMRKHWYFLLEGDLKTGEQIVLENYTGDTITLGAHASALESID